MLSKAPAISGLMSWRLTGFYLMKTPGQNIWPGKNHHGAGCLIPCLDIFPFSIVNAPFFVLFNPISWTELGCKVNDIKVKLSLQFTSSFCFDAESPAHDPALAHPEDKLRTALLAFFSLLIRSFQELGIVRHIYHCHTQFTSQQPALKLLPITSILSLLYSSPSALTPMLASRAHREF